VKIQYKDFYKKELNKSKQRLDENIIPVLIATAVMFPPIVSLLNKIISTIIARLPSFIIKKDMENLDLLGKLQSMSESLLNFADKIGDLYIKSIIKIFYFVPKIRNYSDEQKKHLAVTLYYTFIIGSIIYICHIKGLPQDKSSEIKTVIQNKLKTLSVDLKFDDVEKTADVIISNQGISPIINKLTDNVVKMLGL